ncbi:protein of unknown function [Enterobacter cancerogenus]|nr:protein of unknown function [Enterobacter cancerogenus]
MPHGTCQPHPSKPLYPTNSHPKEFTERGKSLSSQDYPYMSPKARYLQRQLNLINNCTTGEAN